MTSAQDNNLFRTLWVQVYEDFYSRLNNAAHRLANGNLSDAEDLMQETIYRALLYPRDPATVENPLSYLLRIMRNAWRDKWVKENTAHTDSLDDILSNEALSKKLPTIELEVLSILENEELQDQMMRNIGRLTSRERLLLDLHLQGYNSSEIASQLNEDVRLIRYDLNAVRSKVRYRLRLLSRR